jgi:predicted DNA-binding antitoxin AbrB/MazE fold protein
MKTVEFPITIKKDGELELPVALKEHLREGQQVRIVVVVDEEKDWKLFTMQQLLKQYSDADAIYDTLE